MQITHLIVLVGCSDGNLRAADLRGKQPKQVQGYIRHIQNGMLTLREPPIAKIADFVNPDGSLKEPVAEAERPRPFGDPNDSMAGGSCT